MATHYAFGKKYLKYHKLHFHIYLSVVKLFLNSQDYYFKIASGNGPFSTTAYGSSPFYTLGQAGLSRICNAVPAGQSLVTESRLVDSLILVIPLWRDPWWGDVTHGAAM